MKVLWKLCPGFSFPAAVITFHSYGDYCSVWYLAKYMHYKSQLDFCLSGTNAMLYSMPYRRDILGYVRCCREEQNFILNSICQPQNALQCNKAVGEIQTIGPGGKKNVTTYPKLFVDISPFLQNLNIFNTLNPTHSIWLWRWIEHRRKKILYSLSQFSIGELH